MQSHKPQDKMTKCQDVLTKENYMSKGKWVVTFFIDGEDQMTDAFFRTEVEAKAFYDSLTIAIWQGIEYDAYGAFAETSTHQYN